MWLTIWEYLPWIAVFSLSLGYWLQVFKIYKHKEVRDISLIGQFLLALGFMIMSIKALEQKNLIFGVKQIMTFIPVALTIRLIFKHKDAHWKEDDPKYCNSCNELLENDWKFCPYCQEERPSVHPKGKIAEETPPEPSHDQLDIK